MDSEADKWGSQTVALNQSRVPSWPLIAPHGPSAGAQAFAELHIPGPKVMTAKKGKGIALPVLGMKSSNTGLELYL